MSNDLAALVPENVVIAFPAIGAFAPSNGFVTYSISLVSLSLPEYSGIVGVPFDNLLHRYEQAECNSSSTPDNDAALTALATQFVTDWYLWQLADVFQTYVGIADWTPEGMHDVTFRQDTVVTTEVRRGEFNPTEDLLYMGTGSTPPPSSPSQWVIELVDGIQVNGKYDSLTQPRDPSIEDWIGSIPPEVMVWGIDLSESIPPLNAGSRYVTNRVLDGSGNAVSEVGGIYYLSIQNANTGNALTDTSFWLPIPYLTNPAIPLAYVAEITPTEDISNATQTITSGSSPTDFASTLTIVITTSNSLSGNLIVTGINASGYTVFENITTIGFPGTLTTSLSLVTVLGIDTSAVTGNMAGDTIQVVITQYPQGSLRDNSGIYYANTATNGVPGSSSDWTAVTPVNGNGYSSSATYAEGDYVQEIRPLFAFNSITIHRVVILSGSFNYNASPGDIIYCLINGSGPIRNINLPALIGSPNDRIVVKRVEAPGGDATNELITINNVGDVNPVSWYGDFGGTNINPVESSIEFGWFAFGLLGSGGSTSTGWWIVACYDVYPDRGGSYGAFYSSPVTAGGTAFGLTFVRGFYTGGTPMATVSEGGTGSNLSGTGPGVLNQATTGAAASVTQVTDIGALSDSTGGTPGLTINAVSGTGDDTTINDNLSSLLTQINALRAALQSIKGMA